MTESRRSSFPRSRYGINFVDSEETIIEARFLPALGISFMFAESACEFSRASPKMLLALTTLLINANFIAISTSSSHLGGARDVKRAMMM